MTDRDPCQGCGHLMHPEGLRPWCARGTQYGQVGCTKKTPRGPAHQTTHVDGAHERGDLGGIPPETARREAARNRKRRGR